MRNLEAGRGPQTPVGAEAGGCERLRKTDWWEVEWRSKILVTRHPQLKKSMEMKTFGWNVSVYIEKIFHV